MSIWMSENDLEGVGSLSDHVDPGNPLVIRLGCKYFYQMSHSLAPQTFLPHHYSLKKKKKKHFNSFIARKALESSPLLIQVFPRRGCQWSRAQPSSSALYPSISFQEEPSCVPLRLASSPVSPGCGLDIRMSNPSQMKSWVTL